MIMSDERRMIGAIVTATFAATLGIGMLIPAVPLLTAGLPAVAHGALVSSFGLARLLLSFPSGLAIDRIGDRVAALAGLALLIAGGLIGIPDLGYAGLILSVVLQGAGISVFSTAAMTALLNKAGPERRGTAQSWFQGALLLSYSAGPVIGGYAVSAFGPRAPFAAEALLGLAALPIALMLPAHVPAQKKKAGFPLTRDFIGGAAMTFAGFLSRIAVSWISVPAVATAILALSPDRYGVIIGVGTALNLLLLPVNARLIDEWSAARLVWVATLVTLAGLALMWLIPTVLVLWIGDRTGDDRHGRSCACGRGGRAAGRPPRVDRLRHRREQNRRRCRHRRGTHSRFRSDNDVQPDRERRLHRLGSRHCRQRGDLRSNTAFRRSGDRKGIGHFPSSMLTMIAAFAIRMESPPS